MKIATWNMANWSHKAHFNEAWDFYINKIGCDILLFQEALPHPEILDINRIVYNQIGGTRLWGSGVYSNKYNIKKFDLNTNFVGSVTGAEIEINENFSLIVVSLYGLMENILNVSYAIPNLHRIFSDLTWLLEGASTKHRIVIGGDFNASIQIDKQQTGNSHRVFFDRLHEFQLVNCFDKFFQDYVQTHRHRRSKFPWQNDYFFISKRLEPLLIDCEVISNETVNKMSDHNPVIIELKVD